MDSLLEKFLKDEISGDELNAELGKLPEEDKKKWDESLASPEVQAQLTAKSKKALEEVSALRKEKKRLETPADPPAPRAEGEEGYATALRKENVDTAFDAFFKKFSILPEDQAHYREVFESNKSGAVGVDKITKVLEKIYTAENSDELLAIKERHEARVAGADDFNERSAGAQGGAGPGGGSDDDKKYSPAVMDWVRESKKRGIIITPEAAEKVLNRGLVRTIG